MAPELTICKSSSTSCTEERRTFTRIASTAYYEQRKSYRSRVSQRDPEASKSMISFSHLCSAGHHRHNNHLRPNSNHPRRIIEAAWVSWEAWRGRPKCNTIIHNTTRNNRHIILTTAERETRASTFAWCRPLRQRHCHLPHPCPLTSDLCLRRSPILIRRPHGMLSESTEAHFVDWDITEDRHVDRAIRELPRTVQVEMLLRGDPRQRVELESSHRVHLLRLQEPQAEACTVFIWAKRSPLTEMIPTTSCVHRAEEGDRSRCWIVTRHRTRAIVITTGGVEEDVTGAAVEEVHRVPHQLRDQFRAWESQHRSEELEESFPPIRQQLTENRETVSGFEGRTRRVLQGCVDPLKTWIRR